MKYPERTVAKYSGPKLIRYGDMVKLTASGTVSGNENGPHPERKP
jgi:hypothetical protein